MSYWKNNSETLGEKMTNTEKSLMVAVVVLGILFAITIPSTMDFYFAKKTPIEANKITESLSVTPEVKPNEMNKDSRC